MQISRTILTALLGMSLIALPGCFLKKKNKVAAAPAPPPPVTQPQPEVILPPPAGEPNRSEPAPPPQPTESTTTEATTQPAPKRKAHPPASRKIVPPPPPKPEENKQATQNPPSGPLTATVTPNEALRQKMTTQQLLDATEANLKSISRTLSADEQTMVSHIRTYMQQSTKATTDGDYEKAYNLAVKAHLLSADLVKH